MDHDRRSGNSSQPASTAPAMDLNRHAGDYSQPASSAPTMDLNSHAGNFSQSVTEAELTAALEALGLRGYSLPRQHSPSGVRPVLNQLPSARDIWRQGQYAAETSSSRRYLQPPYHPALGSHYSLPRPRPLPSFRTAGASTSRHRPCNGWLAAPVDSLLPYGSFIGSCCGAPASGGLSFEEVRLRVLGGPIESSLAMSASASEHLVRILREGDHLERRNVLLGVLDGVHKVMESRFGHHVFVALLQACATVRDEVYSIVLAATTSRRRGVLLKVAKQTLGERSVKALIATVAPYHDLAVLVIYNLAVGGLMEETNLGERLLLYCLSEVPYHASRYLIIFAIESWDSLIMSSSGSKCLAKCFRHAQDEEFVALVGKVLVDVRQLCMGPYSNFFVQSVLEHGIELLNERIVKQVMAAVVELSLDQFASYVVETCFFKTSREVREVVIDTFLGLSDGELSELVQSGSANYVVHKLLGSMIDPNTGFPAKALELARRIGHLPEAALSTIHAKPVAKVARKLLDPRQAKSRGVCS